jgi:hypothetical protein
MSIDPATGLVNWLSGHDQDGTSVPVTVEAIDANGAIDTQTYTVAVSEATPGTASTLMFMSTLITTVPVPITSEGVGQTYTYTPTVVYVPGTGAPANDGPLTYTLISGPDISKRYPGDLMTIDSTTGTLTWKPQPNDYGQNPSNHEGFLVTIRGTDALGNSDVQQFNPYVGGTYRDEPQFVSSPVVAATVGQAYSYQAVAIDTDGGLLTYRLAVGPDGMSIDPTTGRLMWTPGLDETGPQGVVVQVDEYVNGVSVGTNYQFFTVTVAGGTYTPPHFTSTPVYSATVGLLYTYLSVATDADGYPLTYDLPVHPDGMVIDPESGAIYWVPSSNEEVSEDVIERVSDGQGGVDLQSFAVAVALADTPPIITSLPTGRPVLGEPYVYDVLAQHAGGGLLRYSLDPSEPPPTDMQFDPSRPNVLDWTPQAAGTIHVLVVVTDEDGNFTTQPVMLTAMSTAADGAPTILSTPPGSVALGTIYDYQVVASDPDGDPLTYHLDATTSPPAGLSLDPSTGFMTWKPTSTDLGPHSFGIYVDDGRGGTYPQTVSIDVTPGSTLTGPLITSSAWLTGVVGQLYSYDATATDPDTNVLAWTLLQATDGLSVNPATGTVRWVPTQVGTYPVQLEVKDPYGDYALQSYTINVLGAAPPPVITSTAPTTGMSDSTYFYLVQATDADGDPLTYALVGSYPDRMQFSTTTPNLLEWTDPVSSDDTPYQIQIEVSDGTLSSTAQSWSLTITGGTPHQPPAFGPNSNPPNTTAPGRAVEFDVSCSFKAICAVFPKIRLEPPLCEQNPEKQGTFCDYPIRPGAVVLSRRWSACPTRRIS